MANLSKFGEKCRAAGLTAYRISKDTGANVQNVHNWMKGNVKPQLTDQLLTVLSYCRQRGIDVSFEDLVW